MYRCIDKIRNQRGIIQLYHLVDISGQKKELVLTGKELKHLMEMCRLQVDNLKLSSDGRIIDNKLDEKFYRYYIYDNYNKRNIGGLFRGIDTVLKVLEDEYEAYEDVEDLNLLVSKLEYILKFPKLDRKDIVFYYTENGNDRVQPKVMKMNDILKDYNFIIKVDITTNVGKVVYRDQDQVAVIISKKHSKVM